MAPFVILRFNFVLPGCDPSRLSAMYHAAVEMAQFGEDHGVAAVSAEEHHVGDDGWSPAPLAVAGLMLGRTRTLRVMVSALLVPLNDPLRLAESIAVLDLASGGRLSVIAGVGYRPEEYAAAGVDWSRRGTIMDESMDAILAGWTGDEFSYRGRKIRISPRPLTPPAGLLFVGGSGRPAARRAARLGLGLAPSAYLPDLQRFYEAECAKHGTTPFTLMPAPKARVTLLAGDPDRAWAEIGDHLLYEARRYRSWCTPDMRSAVLSAANSVDELRAEGVYQILSPEEAVAQFSEERAGPIVLHPLCGGIPPERGWETVSLCVDKVLPALS